jgi:chromosome segregation ATPase
MADTDDKITVHNLQVEYDKLTNAIPKKAAELSLIYKDIERAKSELAQIETTKSQSLADIESKEKDLQEKHTGLSNHQISVSENVAQLGTQLLAIQSDIKLATKELVRSNAKVLAAEEEYTKYQAILANIEELEAQNSLKVIERDIILEQVRLLDEERIKILEDISTKTLESDSKLKEAREELSKLVYLSSEKQKEADQAAFRVKTYTDELYTHMNNYQIVKARLEGVWKQTFPELELPI